MEQNELRTPCYIIHERQLTSNLLDFQEAIGQVYGRGIVGYSFKTNSTPCILKCVKRCGCYAEVVSDMEYSLAEKMGFSYENIIYNGPIKSERTFFSAYANNAIINVDSTKELEWLKQAVGSKSPRGIGLRVNFDLDKELPGSTITGAEGGRFGFSVETGELHRVIEFCQDDLGVPVIGLHMHISTKVKSVEVYRKLTDIAGRIAKREQLQLKYIDIGGGFFGGGDHGEAYREYVFAIREGLMAHGIDNATLIVEPGASVVATAVDYLTKVVSKKDTSHGRFVIMDGSRLHIDPFMHRTKQTYSLYVDSEECFDSQVLCGYTCMENDRLMKLEGERELQIGDKVLFHTVGSYTMCFNSNFIEGMPYIYMERDGMYCMVRDKWQIDECLQKNVVGFGA